jgi:competence protein ComEC
MAIGWWRSLLLKQVITILSIWAFAFMVGLSPSVVRSSFMISIYALLSLGYREKMSVNTLAFTAIVMLVVNPCSLYDVGFQLSFAAVLAILVLNPLFSKVIPLHVLQRHRWLRFWWGLTTVSISAQMGTAPLVAYYFGTFSTYFLLSNYIVIPLASAILYLTLACLMTSWWIGLQSWLVVLLGWIVGTMNRTLEVIGALPKSCVEGISLSTLQLYLIYILIGSLVVLLSLWINSKYVKQLTEV